MEKNTSEEEVIPSRIIDAKHIHSPLPLLRLKKEMALMRSDEVIRIDCTDPGAGNDIANWCLKMDHSFLGEKIETDYSSFFVKK